MPRANPGLATDVEDQPAGAKLAYKSGRFWYGRGVGLGGMGWSVARNGVIFSFAPSRMPPVRERAGKALAPLRVPAAEDDRPKITDLEWNPLGA